MYLSHEQQRRLLDRQRSPRIFRVSDMADCVFCGLPDASWTGSEHAHIECFIDAEVDG